MQLALQFHDPRLPDLASEVQELVTWLANQHGWRKASQIQDALGIPERALRSLASTSRGLIVSGPGCPGYKFVGNCTPDEIRETVQRLDHQAAVMQTRAREIRSQAHSRL